jgi:acyl carrier protein
METKFLESLKEILEIEDRELSLDDNFREYAEWDSLANLSVVAMIDDEFDVVIENSDFKKLLTIRELVEEIKKRTSV